MFFCNFVRFIYKLASELRQTIITCSVNSTALSHSASNTGHEAHTTRAKNVSERYLFICIIISFIEHIII